MDSYYLQLTYSRLFWRQFAYRVGAMAVQEPGGFPWLAGVPLAVSYRPWTVSFEEAAAYALKETIFDTVYDGLSGRSDQIGSDILFNLFWLLFRKELNGLILTGANGFLGIQRSHLRPCSPLWRRRPQAIHPHLAHEP